MMIQTFLLFGICKGLFINSLLPSFSLSFHRCPSLCNVYVSLSLSLACPSGPSCFSQRRCSTGRVRKQTDSVRRSPGRVAHLAVSWRIDWCRRIPVPRSPLLVSRFLFNISADFRICCGDCIVSKILLLLPLLLVRRDGSDVRGFATSLSTQELQNSSAIEISHNYFCEDSIVKMAPIAAAGRVWPWSSECILNLKSLADSVSGDDDAGSSLPNQTFRRHIKLDTWTRNLSACTAFHPFVRPSVHLSSHPSVHLFICRALQRQWLLV